MTASERRAPSELRLERVTRWYGDVIALNDVQLTFGPGVTGLLGPNGAGKTTMIRLMVGLASAGDGRVLLDGVPVRNNLAALARIGYVADGDGLYEDQKARRFLTDQARLRGFVGEGAARRVDEVLERVGLTAAADRLIGGFSKGMRQRVKLAQALLHDPDVLVLDEPLTGLDPLMRRDFIRVVRELGDAGVTVVVSSHVLHEIEAMTDSIVLMRYGQVLAEGTVGDIRDKLDTEPRRVALGTADTGALATLLIREEGLVSGLAFDDGVLTVRTLQPEKLCATVQKLVVDGDAQVTTVDPLDEDLRSVFAYLVQ
ncbi:MAG: ABC-2 type transport system ATP-binding protein [Pseudohongiellaceae bacterium]|jgi:ABC-2 type transport system ATP-binding protein